MSSNNTNICATDPSGSDSQLMDSCRPRLEGLRVIEVNLDDPRLAPFVDAHPSSTVYHHPAWLRTLNAEYARGIMVLGCEDRDARLLGMFSLMYTRGFRVPLGGGHAKARLSSLPRTPIAGPLCVSQEASRFLVSAAIGRVSQQRGIRLQIKTEGPLLDGLVQSFPGLPWRHSFVLPVSQDPSQLRIGSSSTQRSRIRWSIKRAGRLGLRVRIASSEEYLHKWYPFYLQTMRRVSVPPRPLRFFQAMWKYMEPLGLMKVMLAERKREGKTELIAGSIFLMHGKRVFYAFTACPAEHFPLRPHDLIQWEAIHWAAQNGFREYDLGEVPNNAVQLASFKAKWGAEERPLYRYYYPQTPVESTDSSVLSTQQKLLGKVWQHVPLRVTAYLGDLIYSYL